MRKLTRRATAAVVGAIVISSVAIGSAADGPVPQVQPQPHPPGYYGGSVEKRYVYPQPPTIYVYPPPPPVAYYDYGPPPIVVLPQPYYVRRHYRLVYGGPSYGQRHYPPYVARGFGRYDRDRGRHHW